MRCHVAVLSVAAAVVGCSTAPDDELTTREQIIKDLKLEITAPADRTLMAGTKPAIGLKVVNTSRTTLHHVVMPGDGSELGWREPYVYFTATYDSGDGKSVDLPNEAYGRCGLYDGEWVKDVVAAKPGEELDLKWWTTGPWFEFQRPGKVRLQAHYAYRGGSNKRGPAPIAQELRGLMRGVPEFELVSEPVEFEVVRPLDVLVKVNRPMTVGKTHLASEVVDVLLVNRSEREIEVSSPTNSADARAAILFEGGEAAKLRYKIWDGETYGIKVKLKPGEAVPLIGPSEFANGHDAKWDTLAPGMVKVRASYTTTTWNPGATILSEWVEVPVLK